MEKVAQFYEEFPYPQLPVSEKKDVAKHLHETVMRRILASADLQPSDLKGKFVLDAGCGTGEKSAYFAIHGAKATGIDLSENSLKIARSNAKKFGVEKMCDFRKIDIFDSTKNFKPNSFDHIFSIGVLHHTKNARDGARILSNLVKPGGTLSLGLYHSYGRIYLRAQRAMARFCSSNDYAKGCTYIERHIICRPFKSDAERAYLADTYLHPHETYHTISEVKTWFREDGLRFLSVTPQPEPPLGEFKWIFQKRGFFTMGARKRS